MSASDQEGVQGAGKQLNKLNIRADGDEEEDEEDEEELSQAVINRLVALKQFHVSLGGVLVSITE